MHGRFIFFFGNIKFLRALEFTKLCYEVMSDGGGADAFILISDVMPYMYVKQEETRH